MRVCDLRSAGRGHGTLESAELQVGHKELPLAWFTVTQSRPGKGIKEAIMVSGVVSSDVATAVVGGDVLTDVVSSDVETAVVDSDDATDVVDSDVKNAVVGSDFVTDVVDSDVVTDVINVGVSDVGVAGGCWSSFRVLLLMLKLRIKQVLLLVLPFILIKFITL